MMDYPPRPHRLLIIVAAAIVGAIVTYFLLGEELRSEPTASTSKADEAASKPDKPAGQAKADEPPPKLPTRPSQADTGIFSDLDDKVHLNFPSWLEDHDVTVVDGPGGGSLFAYVSGTPVALAHNEMGESTVIADWGKNDADRDGIPNALDILIGAKKTALNKAKYEGGYEGLDYPGGDVARTKGVCTEVLIRAVRNAGIDLQKELHEDIEAHPKAYPMVKSPDPNIDQRRVKTLLPYFKRHWTSLSTEKSTGKKAAWAPGDVVFMNTMRDARPDHVGVVSDELGDSGRPLIINNWTDGYHTQAMDLLDFVPVTHRFRVPSGALKAATKLDRDLERHGVELDHKHRQAVLVEAESATNSRATLRRYERSQKGGWKTVGEAKPVRLGHAGLGKGRGLYPVQTTLAPKQEGDRRAPAGVFALGTAFGTVDKPYRGGWPWRAVDIRDRWVDDPKSSKYNSWQRAPEGGEAEWASAEKLNMYRVGLVVEHNMNPAEPGAGSAIFLHNWSGDEGTLGCTGMSEDALIEILSWLDPVGHPVLVQVVGPRGDE